MIGRKLVLLKNSTLSVNNKKPIIKIPNLQEVRYTVSKSSKRYGFISLVIILRISVLSSHFLKKTYVTGKEKTIYLIQKYIFKRKGNQIKEASKFLKAISDYKQKIKKIKHRIKEEEGIE
jgi:hypothetical protein